MVSRGLTAFCFWVKWRVSGVKRHARILLPSPAGMGRKDDGRRLPQSRGFKKLNRLLHKLLSSYYHKSITKLLLRAMSPLVALFCGAQLKLTSHHPRACTVNSSTDSWYVFVKRGKSFDGKSTRAGLCAFSSFGLGSLTLSCF